MCGGVWEHPGNPCGWSPSLLAFPRHYSEVKLSSLSFTRALATAVQRRSRNSISPSVSTSQTFSDVLRQSQTFQWSEDFQVTTSSGASAGQRTPDISVSDNISCLTERYSSEGKSAQVRTWLHYVWWPPWMLSELIQFKSSTPTVRKLCSAIWTPPLSRQPVWFQGKLKIFLKNIKSPNLFLHLIFAWLFSPKNCQ